MVGIFCPHSQAWLQNLKVGSASHKSSLDIQSSHCIWYETISNHETAMVYQEKSRVCNNDSCGIPISLWSPDACQNTWIIPCLTHQNPPKSTKPICKNFSFIFLHQTRQVISGFTRQQFPRWILILRHGQVILRPRHRLLVKLCPTTNKGPCEKKQKNINQFEIRFSLFTHVKIFVYSCLAWKQELSDKTPDKLRTQTN